MFETAEDVLAWYESRPRTLNKEFVASVEWHQVKQHVLDPAFLPVLVYMRDVELFTDLYHREMLRTPAGKDRVINRFMERWSVEELEHAELLNRFLQEAGVQSEGSWQAEARSRIPFRYTCGSYVVDHLAKVFGRYFHAVPMVWGAINEITTLQGYRRLASLAGHPVLAHLLSGIMKEESVHATFYWNLARLKLGEARFSRVLARSLVAHFWSPVGQGAKPKRETDYVMATLFRGASGLEFFDGVVSNRIEQLPGFEHFTKLSERVAPVLCNWQRHAPAFACVENTP